MAVISYEFDDLALLTNGKHYGMFVAGEAVIWVDSPSDWYVRELKIDGIEVDRHIDRDLWLRIMTALEEQHGGSINDKARMEDENTMLRMRGAA